MKHFFAILISLLALTAAAQDSLWVQVRIPVACIREGKGHATEMSSQAIMGTPMLILEDDGGEWLKLRGPEGYEGYMNVSSVARKSQAEMEAWRKARRAVQNLMAEVKVWADTTTFSSHSVVTELVNGSIVEADPSTGNFTHITLPDGRDGYIVTSAILPSEQWATQPYDADAIIDRCYWLRGTPYLWGACSTKSVDCSGLVRVALYANGILTLRDARQQIEIGGRIEPEDTDSLQRGDLLFFSTTPDGRISHVALYDHDKKYIHSSGLVKTNHMTPDDPDFGPRYYRGASRIKGYEGTEGIWQIINHPWYFNQ